MKWGFQRAGSERTRKCQRTVRGGVRGGGGGGGARQVCSPGVVVVRSPSPSGV